MRLDDLKDIEQRLKDLKFDTEQRLKDLKFDTEHRNRLRDVIADQIMREILAD